MKAPEMHRSLGSGSPPPGRTAGTHGRPPEGGRCDRASLWAPLCFPSAECALVFMGRPLPDAPCFLGLPCLPRCSKLRVSSSQRFFSLKHSLIEVDLCTPRCTHFKCTVQWLLASSQICATIATVSVKIFLSSLKETGSPLAVTPPYLLLSPGPRQPLSCFRFLERLRLRVSCEWNPVTGPFCDSLVTRRNVFSHAAVSVAGVAVPVRQTRRPKGGGPSPRGRQCWPRVRIRGPSSSFRADGTTVTGDREGKIPYVRCAPASPTEQRGLWDLPRAAEKGATPNSALVLQNPSSRVFTEHVNHTLPHSLSLFGFNGSSLVFSFW